MKVKLALFAGAVAASLGAMLLTSVPVFPFTFNGKIGKVTIALKGT